MNQRQISEHWGFFRGDRVELLVGRDKGKQGIIKQVIQERNWVMVEGLNTHLRRMGKTEKFPGVLLKSESPLLVCSLGDLSHASIDQIVSSAGH